MRERSGFTRRLCAGAFVFLMLLTLVVSYVWLARNRVPPYGSVPPVQAMRFYLAWQGHRANLYDIGTFFEQRHPPLAYFLYVGYFFIGGLQETGREMLVNTLFLAVTLVALFRLGRALYDECVALVAVAFFLSSSGMLVYSRRGLTEFALMGMVTLSISLLVESDYFSNRKYAILFGIALGLAALTKYTFLLFIAGPLLAVVAYIVFRRSSPQAPFNMLYSALVALALCLPWYRTHLPDLWQRFHIDKIDASCKDFSFTGANLAAFWDSCRYYFHVSTTSPGGGFFDVNLFVIFCWACCCYLFYYFFQVLVRRQACRFISYKTLLLLSWIVLPLTALCLPVFRGIRLGPHLLPVLPACALALSAVLLRIRFKTVKYLLLGCALCAALPQWYLNFYVPFLQLPAQKVVPFRIKIAVSPGLSGSKPVRFSLAGCSAAELQRARVLPSQENWRYREILDLILRDCASHCLQIGQPNILLIGGDYIFRYSGFAYVNLQMGDQVMVIDPFTEHFALFTKSQSLSKAIFAAEFDYVLLRNDPLYPFPSMRECIDYLKQHETEFRRLYTEIAQFTLPDESRVVIYKRSALCNAGT